MTEEKIHKTHPVKKKEVKGKKPIPPVAWLIIGAAMVLMSVFIDVEKLLTFILVGAVFIVVGFIKTIMGIEEKKHKTRKAKRHAHKRHPHAPGQHKPGQHPTHQTKKTPGGTHTTAVRCRGCGVKLHPGFKFCPSCGQKLK